MDPIRRVGIGPLGSVAIAVAIVGTLTLGVWLRWFLAGQATLFTDFRHLRHAHSHLGYFGVLFPLAWLGWRQVQARAPGRVAVWIYAIATAVSFFGFLRAGYGPEAIAGSTVVGGVWLWSGWRLRRRLLNLWDPLALVLPGVILAEACIPPIAIFLRRDPALAQGFVATFLTVLLLAVLVPSALAARRVTAGPWPVLLIAAALGAAALGVWDALPARIGLVVYALLLGWAAGRGALPVHLRLAWGAVAAGLLCLALGLIPNVRPVAVGAIHFLVLAPVLGSLADSWLRRPPPAWAWLMNHALVGVMAGALVAQGLGLGGWTLTAAAIGGTGVALWWAVVLLAQVPTSAAP